MYAVVILCKVFPFDNGTNVSLDRMVTSDSMKEEIFGCISFNHFCFRAPSLFGVKPCLTIVLKKNKKQT